MRVIAAWNDQCRSVQLEHFLWLGPGDRVAIEERPSHTRDENGVSTRILPHVRFGEGLVVSQDSRPRSYARVLAEVLAAAPGKHYDLLKAFLLDVRKVLGETGMTCDPILRAACRPVHDHAQDDVRMGDPECRDRGAALATTHEVGSLDAQVIEQSLALCHVVSPGDALNAPPGLAGLPPIEHYARVVLGEVFDRPDATVNAQSHPIVHCRVEPARREHQQRGPGPYHLVLCRDSVNIDDRHVSLPPAARMKA
jgi:hypothetical protein